MSELTLRNAKYTFNILGNVIREIEVKTDDFVKSINFVEKNWPDNTKLLNFYKASIQLNLMALDYCAAIRLYLSGTTFYEERFAIKSLIVNSKESYKRLYGFTESSRNKGLWRKYLKPLSENFTKLCKEAENIEISLSQFNAPLITDDKQSRDVAVHYSDNYLENYNLLKDLDAELVVHGSAELNKIIILIRAYIFHVGIEYGIIDNTSSAAKTPPK